MFDHRNVSRGGNVAPPVRTSKSAWLRSSELQPPNDISDPYVDAMAMSDNNEKLLADSEIETLIFSLIERHLTDYEQKKGALDWLTERVASYKAVQELGLLGDEPL